MINITLKEFLGDESIWTEIQTIENFPFFDELTALELDLMQVIKFGSRSVFSGYNDIQVDFAAKMIVNNFSNKWNRLIEFHSKDLDLGSEYTISVDEKIDSKDDNSTTNQSSAYNDDSMVDDTKVIEDNTGVRNKVSDTNKISLEYLFKNLQSSDKTNIINTVLDDTANYLCISIY